MRFYRVRALYAPSPRLGGFVTANGSVSFSVPTVSGALYIVQYKDHLDDPVWSELSRQTGTGQPILVTDPNPSGPTRFYRVQVQ
jgi:hypothetical protein